MMRRLWQTSPELVATAALMAPVLGGAIVGLAIDPTVIAGAPAWLKPAKFAVSIVIYTLTLAWVFTYLPATQFNFIQDYDNNNGKFRDHPLNPDPADTVVPVNYLGDVGAHVARQRHVAPIRCKRWHPV